MTIHHTADPFADKSVPDPHQDTFSKTTLGFWMYLMTDCLLFACLFATYAVLHKSTFGGPPARELFNLQVSFLETLILLTSSLTSGLAILSAVEGKKNRAIVWLAISFLLGYSFVTIEITEFAHLVHEGNDWTRSAFLSSFFALVGTHGLHVTVGLLWMLVIMGQLFWSGITRITFRRLAVFILYWHFLDLIWIFIFTFVYLMGVV